MKTIEKEYHHIDNGGLTFAVEHETEEGKILETIVRIRVSRYENVSEFSFNLANYFDNSTKEQLRMIQRVITRSLKHLGD